MKFTHPLFKTAQRQAGLFTCQQAVKSGIDFRNHSYHLRAGNWSRLSRGLYRLNFVSKNAREKFFFFQLWARSKRGDLVGAFSHQTALYLMGLVSPPLSYHITVPSDFRRTSPLPDEVTLHYEDLHFSDKTKSDDGLIRTSIKKTFQDVMACGMQSPEWIKQKIKKAILQKQVSLEEIKKIPVQEEKKQIFKAILFELEE